MAKKEAYGFLVGSFLILSAMPLFAVDQIPEEAKQQLVSQAESFRKESAKRPEKKPVPAEIVVKKKKKN